jgi:phosphatidylinositol-3-phosphatase
MSQHSRELRRTITIQQVFGNQRETHWRRARRLAVVAVSVVLLSVAVGHTSAAASGGVPAFDHVFVIVMENHSYAQIIGNTSQAPYINQLAGQHGLATNYFAVTHPSLPNYLALIGGSTFGITTDCTTCFVNAPNLAADRLVPSGRSWKGYMESMPSTCYLGSTSLYAQKHNPFVYFNDVRTTSQCNNIVPFTQLAGNLTSTSTTPDYVWITPNLCNDMHDCSISTGDTWLKNNVPTILNSPAYTSQNSLLLITWDEDDSSQSNHVPTIVIAKSVSAGFRSTTHYTHYSLLKTIEQAWGLAPLTANDTNASAMSDFFGATSAPLPPGAPTNVVATPSPRSATVSWTAPASNGCAISSYTVTSSPGGIKVTTAGTARSARLDGLKAGTSYRFTVVAANCAGAGPASAPSNAVIPTKH